MSDTEKLVQLNRSQSRIHLVNANVTYFLGPRAGGKTTGGLGPRIERLNNVMPRSQSIIYTDTFERLHDRTIPNLVQYWQDELKLIDGQDFVCFKKPPVGWQKPLIPLEKFDHVVTFANGFSLCGASQKIPGSANAYNAQSLNVDEAKYIKEVKINTEVLPALRGAFRHFGHLPEYRSHWYFTDKWEGNIKWLLKKRDLMNEPLVKAVMTMQLEIFRLQKEMEQYSSSRTQYKYINQIKVYEEKLNSIRRNLVYVCDAQPYENLGALGEKYFRDLRRDLSDYEYRVAILNEDPDKVMNTFYPSLNRQQHFHNCMQDIATDQPLIIGMDYNWRITPMAVGQYGQLPGKEHRTFNVVAGVHTLHPTGGIAETCKAFSNFFTHHHNKTVFYIFDHTAVGKRPDGDAFYEIVTRSLLALGWQVIQIYIGQAPDHDRKYEALIDLMTNDEEDAICINEVRCADMCKSIQQAGAITSSGQTKKDKSKEKDLAFPAEETTDYSDAFDTLLWGTLQLGKVPATYTHSVGGIAIR